ILGAAVGDLELAGSDQLDGRGKIRRPAAENIGGGADLDALRLEVIGHLVQRRRHALLPGASLGRGARGLHAAEEIDQSGAADQERLTNLIALCGCQETDRLSPAKAEQLLNG